MAQVSTTIAGRPFSLERGAIERRLRDELPEPLVSHYVVVEGRRFPPKQVVSLVTGLDRADFTTHQSRQLLRRLGFTVGRKVAPAPSASTGRRGPHGGQEADALRPHMGRWVAQRGVEVLVSAGTPGEVLSWLERHNQQADAVFLVPRNAWEASGLGPQ